MPKVEEKLHQMGFKLPTLPGPTASPVIRAYRTGNLVFLSGAGPRAADGKLVVGKLGKEITVEQGYDAARLCALSHLATLKEVIGDLDKVKHIVKVFGMVNAMPDFTRSSEVINGFSELLLQAFGERGRHARSAVGMVTLPGGMAVEVEMIVEVEG